jgi:hypothetical protein
MRHPRPLVGPGHTAGPRGSASCFLGSQCRAVPLWNLPRRAPRGGGGRSTRPRRSGCCRVGRGRRCRAGDRYARPGQTPSGSPRVRPAPAALLIQAKQPGMPTIFPVITATDGPFGHGSALSATGRPAERPQGVGPGAALLFTLARPRGSLRGRLCWNWAGQGGLSGPYPCAGADRPRLTPLGRAKAPTARLAKAPPRRPSSPPAGAARRRPWNRRWRRRRGGPRRRLRRRRGV